MNETLEYIDDYFTGTLPDAERAAFESRISTDETFAQEVAFYLSARQAMRQTLLHQKRQDWERAEPAVETAPAPVVPLKRGNNWRKTLAVAASLFIVFAASLFILFNKKSTPQLLATQYAKQHFTQLSGSMGNADSLQQGIEAYNRKDYETAGNLFSSIYAANANQTDALKYNGLVSLQQKDYDQAISQFKLLAGHTELRANPGMFYQAIALLQRNKQGDAGEARKLLEQVASEKQEGDTQAKEWLKKF